MTPRFSDTLLTVAHPGLVVHAPPRGASIRNEIVRVDTPMRLRSLSWSETADGPRVPVDETRWVRTRLIDGRPWRVVGDDDCVRGRKEGAALAIDGFRDWLSGTGLHPAKIDQSQAIRCFAGTPMVASPTAAMSTLPIRPLRPIADLGLGRIVRDYRTGAQAAVTAYLGRDLALVDGIPMVRMRGPVAQFSPPTDSEFSSGVSDIMIPRFPGWPDPRVSGAGYFYRIDRAKEAKERQGIPVVVVDWEEGRRNGRRVDWTGCLLDSVDDVWLTMHDILQGLIPWVTKYGSHGEWEFEDKRLSVLGYAERAATHMLVEDELDDVCSVIASLDGARLSLFDSWERAGATPTRLVEVGKRRQLDYVRDHARPVLDEHGPDRTPDIEALVKVLP